MAGSLNKVLLIGRLGADPEIKQMVNGKSVARLSLATSQSWKVSAQDVLRHAANLDLKNPNKPILTIRDFSEFVNYFSEIRDKINLCMDAVKRLSTLEKSLESQNWNAQNFKLEEVAEIEKGRFPTMKTPEGPYKFVVTAADRRTADDYQFDKPAVCVPMVSSTGHGHGAIHRIHYEEGNLALST